MGNKSLWNEVEVPTGNAGGDKQDRKFENIPNGRNRVGILKLVDTYSGDYGESITIAIYDAASNIKQRFFYGTDMSYERNVTNMKRLLASLGLAIPNDPADVLALLKRKEGAEIKFDKWEGDNKKNPSKPYQNLAITAVVGVAKMTENVPSDNNLADDDVPF